MTPRAARRERARSSTDGRASSVSVVALLAVTLVAEPVSAELCTARVELEGDTAVVGEVTAELARIGVERGAPAPGCRGVYAQVATDRDGIAVAIRDGARRSEGRVVSDAAIAASWIDSWLHDDLDGRAWLIAAPVTVPARPAATTTAVVEPPHGSALAGSHLTASWEHVWTDDGASADGVGLAACLRFGRVCVGARARYVREADRSLETTAMARSDTSLMATLTLPLRAGRMSIAPEVGGGFGRTATRRIESCSTSPNDPSMPPANCDPMDPTCVPQPVPCDTAGKVFVGDDFSTATYSPRLAAGVRLAIPLFEHVWLDGLFSFSVSPLAHGGSFGNTPTMSPDGSIVPGTLYALPGEPTFGMWLGIGLRVGAP